MAMADETLERAFNHYLQTTYGGQQSQLVVIDGKTMRGTIPQGSTRGVHLLAAYLPAEGVVLKQVAVDLKENEITAAPELVAEMNLKHRVVCGDAMHTQRSLSTTVLSQGGDYLWFAKDNQPALLSDVVQYFQPPQKAAGWPLPEMRRTVAESTTLQHGRLERRTLTLLVDETGFLDWPGVRQVFRLERHVHSLRTGVTTTEVVYGLTSYPPAQHAAEQLLAWTRDYWGIENGLHYRRDVTLREDATRFSQPAMARAMAVINNFLIGLVRKLGYGNLAAARRIFNAQIAAQLPY
jgi:predicted transposase YbfD/YdcC